MSIEFEGDGTARSPASLSHAAATQTNEQHSLANTEKNATGNLKPCDQISLFSLLTPMQIHRHTYTRFNVIDGGEKIKRPIKKSTWYIRPPVTYTKQLLVWVSHGNDGNRLMDSSRTWAYCFYTWLFYWWENASYQRCYVASMFAAVSSNVSERLCFSLAHFFLVEVSLPVFFSQVACCSFLLLVQRSKTFKMMLLMW